MHFVRVLRAAGLPVGPARALAALEAVEAVGLANRDDFRAALAAVLVSRHEQLPIFEQAFDLFWRNPRLLEKLIAALLPTVFGRGGEQDAPPELPARIAQAMLPPRDSSPARRRRRDRARRGVHDVAARGAAAQGLRDDDRRGARRGARDAGAAPTAAARTADAAHRAVVAATGSTFAPRCAARPAPPARCRRSPGGGGSGARRRSSCCATSRARWTATRACCCTSCTRSRTTRTACTCSCSARGSPTSRATCGIATSTSRCRASRPPCPTGRAARGSAAASTSSTAAGRGGCSARTPSCC